VSRRDDLIANATSAKGFMPPAEGLALLEQGLRAGRRTPGGTWLEVGAWCGKSAIYLGAAAEESGSVLYSLDHHHGSEENQAGWEHFDESLVDPLDGRLNTLPTWQRTIADARLEATVVGLVGPSSSPLISRRLSTCCSLTEVTVTTSPGPTSSTGRPKW
jgi:hypothetical protein